MCKLVSKTAPFFLDENRKTVYRPIVRIQLYHRDWCQLNKKIYKYTYSLSSTTHYLPNAERRKQDKSQNEYSYARQR